jgi:anti-sigma B factor antagonist
MVEGRFPVEVVNGVPVVTAPEEIDITNAPELRAALLEAAAHGHGMLVADLSRTRFCDSSGLHTLLAPHKRAQAEGSELLLVMTSRPVLRVFALTGVDRMIRNFTSLDEALAYRPANGSAGPRAADYRPDGSTATTAGLTARTALADLTEELADRAAAHQDWLALLACGAWPAAALGAQPLPHEPARTEPGSRDQPRRRSSRVAVASARLPAAS